MYGFGIEKPSEIDMPWNKETKTQTVETTTAEQFGGIILRVYINEGWRNTQ